jgi:ABC-type transport system involved in multi-copper enzyme maturation permease subunit
VQGFLNTVRAELFKLARKRRTVVLALFLWLLVPALLLFVGWVIQTRVAGTFAEGGLNVRELVQLVASPVGIARNLLLLLGNLSPSLLIILVALTAALLMGEERTQNMWKTVLTVQPNRFAVLSGKLAAGMLYLGALLFGMLLGGLLLGALGTLFLPTTFGAGVGELVGLYALQWLFSLAALLFAFLMIWLFRSLPLGIVSIFFLPALLEGAYGFYQVVVGFERLNRLNALLQVLRLRNTLEELPRYFFSTNLYAPSREPVAALARLFGGLGGDGAAQLGTTPFGNLLAPSLSHAALVMGVYALIFGVLLFWSFARRDIA